MFPSFFDILDIVFVKADETVDIDVGEFMILLPCAPEMVEKALTRK